MRGVSALFPIPAAIVHAHRFGTAAAWVAVGACLVASAVAGIRWLRVAQREHYLAGSVTRFARRWWLTSPLGVGLATLSVAAVVASVWWPVAALGRAAVVVAGPIGLGVRGRTSPLRWTRRLQTLAATTVLLAGVLVVGGWLIGIAPVVAAAVAILVPLVVDAACGLTAPVERRMADRFVARPRPVCSASTRPSWPSPVPTGRRRPRATWPSWWDRPGRSWPRRPASTTGPAWPGPSTSTWPRAPRCSWPRWAPTGPGEIAELCRWCPPDIAVITAIGPVHLERFGTEDRIVEAKSEILEPAATGRAPRRRPASGRPG